MELRDILKEAFNVTEADYTDETSLMSFGEWDSMAHMLFITKLEQAYGIDFTGQEIESMLTIGNIREVLKSKAK